ncbi:MAG: agmatine deiminase family protein [Pseudomonadales bacterium]|nr:agmatine deiminase family protein [Pseudomonadales bacterium]
MPHHFPSEWAKQSAVLLSWPHADTDWAPTLERVEQCYQTIVLAIIRFQKVIIVCHDEKLQQRVLSFFSDQDNIGNIQCWVTPTDDTWIRDYGPLSIIKDQQAELLDFQFNGWGNKFEASQDNAVSLRLHHLGVFNSTPIRTLPLILEGGSIESDGEGTLLTTKHCQMSPERNPDLTQNEIESSLKDFFGAQRVLWLTHGQLDGDDTDGHIDTLVRFCSPSHLCYVGCDDPSDGHHLEIRRMETELKALRSASGEPYQLTSLPWPTAKYNQQGDRLPATYANCLIINGAVLLPVYNDKKDGEAITVLQSCFPEREIIPINCLPLIEQFGSLHCITMQLPTGVI